MLETLPTSPAFQDATGHQPDGALAVPVDVLLARMRAGDRQAAAVFLTDYGDLIRRRVRGKLGASVRRMFDSLDILSTVGRRFDRYVRDGKLQAIDEPQLWSLLFRMAEAAVLDKVRAVKRLEVAEGEDGPIARVLLARIQDAEQGSGNGADIVLEKVLAVLPSDDDRSVLTLWLTDWPLFRIAEALGTTPAAVRQRWRSIRLRLREKLDAGEI
jgi:DNA-directed RNA polymerase specialized sigma24 family protein